MDSVGPGYGWSVGLGGGKWMDILTASNGEVKLTIGI